MEIKKGISQMAEYPNAEVNYVVPADGQMYYVLKDGELANGCVIATLDAKRAVDPAVSCDNIGVFKEDGTVLIDFDKKEIKKINDDCLLVVNAIPKTESVVNALKNMDDEISKTMVKDNSTTIVDKMMIEMGITGEILFSDAYSEANVYKMDDVNHKIGPDSSFIGKNDTNFYFHTNDTTKDTVLVNLNGEVVEKEPTGFAMPEEPITNNIPQEVSEPKTPEVKDEEVAAEEEVQATDFEASDMESQDLKLDISQNILDGFKPQEENIKEDITEEKEDTAMEIPTGTETEVEEENDTVLDNVIEVMKKMIEETNKLNEKIAGLEKEIEEKNGIIASQESKIESENTKKNKLNDLLDEANEVLENID